DGLVDLLGPLGALLDGAETRRGIELGRGERGEHRRDVVRAATFVRGRDRDGAAGDEARGGELALLVEVASQSAGGEREHHVVDRAAEGVLDLLDAGEREPRESGVALRRERSVPATP